MTVNTEFARNDLLRALPEEQRRRMLPRFDQVELRAGQVIADVGRRPSHVFFPTTCVVTMHHVLEDCFASAFAIAGHDGAVSLDAMFSDKPSADRAVVMQGGGALRIDKRALRWEFFRSQEVQQVLTQYTWSLMGFVAQTSVCNRHHSLDRRLCRWLLLAQDLSMGDDLTITQESLSQMLGVRREGVTQAAGRLQAAGLIAHRRGHVTIVDRAGLEAAACECYATSRRGPTRLSPTITRPTTTNTADNHAAFLRAAG